jgi:hypothetical protein
VKFHVIELDNKLFDTVGDIRRAITAHLACQIRHKPHTWH